MLGATNRVLMSASRQGGGCDVDVSDANKAWAWTADFPGNNITININVQDFLEKCGVTGNYPMSIAIESMSWLADGSGANGEANISGGVMSLIRFEGSCDIAGDFKITGAHGKTVEDVTLCIYSYSCNSCGCGDS